MQEKWKNARGGNEPEGNLLGNERKWNAMRSASYRSVCRDGAVCGGDGGQRGEAKESVASHTENPYGGARWEAGGFGLAVGQHVGWT